MEEYTTIPRARSTREIRDAAAELSRLLTAARVHVASQSYRPCAKCKAIFAPTHTTDRLCPDCAAWQVAHGPCPLPS